MTRELCIMACVFCRDPMFIAWARATFPHEPIDPKYADLMPKSEEVAKRLILEICDIKSRNELDTNPEAAKRFHDQIRLPYLAWREQQ